ncbi:MAG: hypothetical protein ACFCU4_04870 [Puniceicoccaceae bacterium]
MKAYDKIALAVAVLLLGVSVFLGQKESVDTVVQRGSSTGLVEGDRPILPPTISLNFERVVWPEPKAQDSEGLWLYEVFTPPMMFNNEGVLKVVPAIPPPPPPPPPPTPPFGVKLEQIVSEPFRFRLESVFEEREASGKYILIFGDRESGITQSSTFRMRQGQTNADRQLRVDELREELETDAGGGLQRAYYAVVTDLSSGRRIRLKNNETVFLQQPTAVLVSTLGTGETVRVTEAGEVFQMNSGTESDGRYEVREFDSGRKELVLVKTAPYLNDPQVRKLRPGLDPDPLPEQEPNATPQKPRSTGQIGLDGFFN